MDAMQMLRELGDVPRADDAIIDAAVEVVLAAAFAERTPSALVSPTTNQRRRRRRVLQGAGLVAVAAAVAAVVVLLPSGGAPAPTGHRRAAGPVHHAPKALTADMVRLISSESAAAMADSGTAVETTTDTGTTAPGSPTTIDVTFSGPNVNYLIAGTGDGATGVENRVVDGQLYLYIEGPDLQMHWYHDTSPDAAASLTFPDPRTLLQAVSPSAGLDDVGQESVDGVELTHLRATNPGPVGQLGIPDINPTVTAFDIWVDRADVVRRMDVSSSDSGVSFECAASPGANDPASGATPTVTIPPADRVSTLPDGKPVPPGVACATARSLHLGSTFAVQFADLGDPENVVAPSGAIDQPGLG